MHRIPVGVLGASGYAGRELCALVAEHPQFELVFATANASRGETMSLASWALEDTSEASSEIPAAGGLERKLVHGQATASATSKMLCSVDEHSQGKTSAPKERGRVSSAARGITFPDPPKCRKPPAAKELG